MSRIIELRVNQLKSLDSDQVVDLLSQVEQYKGLDLMRTLNGSHETLIDTLCLKLLDQLEFAFAFCDSSKGENLEFLKKLIDLKPILVSVEIELMAKIEEKMLEKLDEMIIKTNHTQSHGQNYKPGLPSRSNTSETSELKKVAKNNQVVSDESNKELVRSSAAPLESNSNPEKDTPHKKGAFSKMLTHLTKGRPKANRSKKNELASEDSGVSKEDLQDIETSTQEKEDPTLEESKEVELPSPAIANLANILNQGTNDVHKNISASQGVNVSAVKESSPKDEIPTKPDRLKVDGSETGKPATAPRPAKKPLPASDDNQVQSESVNVSPLKPKVASRPPKAVEMPQSSENPLNESISPISKSPVDGSCSSDIEPRRFSSHSIGSSVNTAGDCPKSDIVTSPRGSLDQASRPISMVEEHSPNGQSLELSSIAPLKRMPGLSGQHGAIGALAAAVTGGRTVAEPFSDIPTEARIAHKPAPPRRPVKNIANENPKPSQTELEHPTPTPRPGINPKTTTERPQSEGILYAGDSSPLDIKRPMSMIEEPEYREENEAQISAPPRRIPGVFATQHGAIGALAAAVTGKRNNSSSNLDSVSPTGANPNSIHTTDAVSSVHDENENAQDSVSASADERSEKSRSPINPVKSNSFTFNPPMTFKKKDTSLSGDDKGIEKSALDWLNQHLAAKDIHIESLYDSLKDGLNLIYAIEDATKESVGKYNKRTMLPVHKIDNLSVALSFLSKKGVDIQFITPQDIMDGNKGKVLTLFVGILKL